LERQFCQENIQFYEVVTIWKATPSTDQERSIKAKSIVDLFVKEGGVCQVNISAVTREKILRTMASDDIPSDIFDEAMEALLQLMYENSFSKFWLIWSKEKGVSVV